MFMKRIRIALTGLATAALLVTASTGVASPRATWRRSTSTARKRSTRPDTDSAMEIEVHSTGEPGGATEEECHEFEVEIAELKDMQENFYDGRGVR